MTATPTTDLATRPANASAAVAAKPPAPPAPTYFQGYEGAAATPFDDRARLVLAEPVDPRDVEVRPDGIVYLSGVWYRRQLTRAFGAGGWAIVPRGQPQKMGEMVIYHGALVALGRFVSEAFGECMTRGGMSYASALEGAKTDCVSRCCKDLGMASELWDKSWRDGWLRDCAIQNGGKWYKRDGSEHDRAPLFVAQPSSPGAATPQAAAGPAAPPPLSPPLGDVADPKAYASGAVEQNQAQTSLAPVTGSTATAATANASERSRSSRPAPTTGRRDSGAKDIKHEPKPKGSGANVIMHDGSKATTEHVKLIRELRAKIPGLAANTTDPRSEWRKKIGAYPKPPTRDCGVCGGNGHGNKGKDASTDCQTCGGRGKICPRVEHTMELSLAQAKHLIDRLQADVDELAAKEREIREGEPTPIAEILPNVLPPANLVEAFGEHLTGTEESEFLRDIVGVDTVDDVRPESRGMVLELLLAYVQGNRNPDSPAFCKAVIKAKSLGHI